MHERAEGRTCALPTAVHPEELEPLLLALTRGEAPTTLMRFPRGALAPDGRLDLCKQGLGPEHTRSVVRALEANTFVTSLLLGADSIADAGARAVAERLAGGSPLTTVFLGCNGIGPEGVAAIAEAASLRAGLRALWLKRNEIGAVGVSAIAAYLRSLGGSTLRTLDLAFTGLGGADLFGLVSALVERRAPLERLYLSGNELAPRDAAALAPLLCSSLPLGLAELYLSSNHLGDEGAKVLGEAIRDGTRLEVLGLASNGIGDRGAEILMEAMRSAPSLEWIDLGSARSAGPAKPLRNDIDPRLRRALTALSATRRPGPRAIAPDVLAARSVYRTTLPKVAGRAPRLPSSAGRELGPADGARAHEPPPSGTELAHATSILERLAAHPALFFGGERSQYAGVRAAANRLVASIVDESRRRREEDRSRPTREDRGAQRRAQRTRDRALIAATELRRARCAERGEPVLPQRSGEVANHLARPRTCYMCRAPYRELDARYDALCPACVAFSRERRERSADLRGQVALVTGGRVKIGRQVVLKLLRAGATVIATTRFPCDAARRYAAELDVEEFRDRLRLVRLDLLELSGLERFTARLESELTRLDIFVSNAAQTIRRPPEYYSELLAGEARGVGALPASIRSVVEPTPPPPGAGLAIERELLFSRGVTDEDGQPLDPRAMNSWRLELGEVAPVELLETHAINCLAPFMLLSNLLPLIERTPARLRHVVLVSAMEGSFSRPYKSAAHPHTNMAKAALNMLTRTSAKSLSARGISLVSVDTGWVTDENPWPVRLRNREDGGFEPPLDAVEGAARVLDPIFSGALGAPVEPGRFYKDYRVTDW